jgi:hypothetical protein
MRNKPLFQTGDARTTTFRVIPLRKRYEHDTSLPVWLRAPTKRGRGGKANCCVQGHNPSPRRPGPGSVNQGHHYVYVNRKRKAYHRLVMENHLCRPLEPWEVVHHIDGNPLNNNIENLQVMSRSEHLVLHLREMPIEQWTDEIDRNHFASDFSTLGSALGHDLQRLG